MTNLWDLADMQMTRLPKYDALSAALSGGEIGAADVFDDLLHMFKHRGEHILSVATLEVASCLDAREGGMLYWIVLDDEPEVMECAEVLASADGYDADSIWDHGCIGMTELRPYTGLANVFMGRADPEAKEDLGHIIGNRRDYLLSSCLWAAMSWLANADNKQLSDLAVNIMRATSENPDRMSTKQAFSLLGELVDDE